MFSERSISSRKSIICEAVVWSSTGHVQNPCDLKSADINRLQLWRESYIIKACNWNFHVKYPISSLLSRLIKISSVAPCLFDDAER